MEHSEDDEEEHPHVPFDDSCSSLLHFGRMEALRRTLEGSHHQWHVFNQLLDTIITATKCGHGYIGEVVVKDGKRFMSVLALTNVSWSPESNALVVPKDLLSEVKDGKPGLLTYAIWREKPFICADIGKHPMRGGQPPGHPPIKSLLSMPFYYGRKLVGVLSLGNREVGFCNENIKQIQETLDFLGFMVILSKDVQLPEFIPYENSQKNTKSLYLIRRLMHISCRI
jgi:GAF domain-containing protein